MIALSTSWKSSIVNDGEALLQALVDARVSEVELEYRITTATFHQMRAPLKRSGLKVVALHNYFPLPPEIDPSQASGDLFRLSHPDKEQRKIAVELTLRCIEHANDLEGGMVVLHCGHVDIEPELDRLHLYYRTDRIESEEARSFIHNKLAERDRSRPKYIDSLLFSLDRLIRLAEKQNVRLALENRRHFHELPGPEDFKILFAEFEGAPLGYWHDTGHARANAMLTLMPETELLSAHEDRLMGIHFHDAKGIEDHLPPGSGDIDFKSFTPFIRADTLLVMELKPGTADSDVSEGFLYLAENGIGNAIATDEKST